MTEQFQTLIRGLDTVTTKADATSRARTIMQLLAPAAEEAERLRFEDKSPDGRKEWNGRIAVFNALAAGGSLSVQITDLGVGHKVYGRPLERGERKVHIHETQKGPDHPGQVQITFKETLVPGVDFLQANGGVTNFLNDGPEAPAVVVAVQKLGETLFRTMPFPPEFAHQPK